MSEQASQTKDEAPKTPSKAKAQRDPRLAGTPYPEGLPATEFTPGGIAHRGVTDAGTVTSFIPHDDADQR